MQVQLSLQYIILNCWSAAVATATLRHELHENLTKYLQITADPVSTELAGGSGAIYYPVIHSFPGFSLLY